MSRAASARSSRLPASGAGTITRSPWIVGRGYDRWFLWAAWCVPLLLWTVTVVLPYPTGLLVALGLFVLLDNAHQVATLPLTIFDPGTMQRSARSYLGGAAAIGLAAVLISLFPDTPLPLPSTSGEPVAIAQVWTSLVVYWGAWHIIRQHYGFLRLYQARDKPADAQLARAEVWALYSGASFPYFLNLANGWASAEGIGKLLYRLPVPWWSPWAVLAVFGLSFGYVLVDALRHAASRERIVSLRLLHILLVVSNFWIGLAWIGRSDIILAILFITSYHDLQYHAVVWHLGRIRTRVEDAPVRSWVKRIFGSAGAFAAAILVGALVQALLRNDFQLAGQLLPQSPLTAALFALVTSYSYMHYFFDGKMWKLSSDPRLRAELGLGR